MLFGIIGRTGAEMRQVVGFTNSATGSPIISRPSKITERITMMATQLKEINNQEAEQK